MEAVEEEVQEEVVEVEGVVVAVVSVLRGHPEDLFRTEEVLVTTVIEAESTIITPMVPLS